ncbi:hypothetical protein FGB62_288g06 [Gracilaria domingensis]|nr:hypothetical protein FGB62_288g06 [Gracilaria domingensis]
MDLTTSDLLRTIAELVALEVKKYARSRAHNSRTSVELFIARLRAGPNTKQNLRRMVLIFRHLDPKDVLVWLSRLRLISVPRRAATRESPFEARRVLDVDEADRLYQDLHLSTGNDDERTKKAAAIDKIYRTAIRLVSTEVVLAVSYSYNDVSDVQKLYRRVVSQRPKLRHVVLWVDRHKGFAAVEPRPWYEYGLVPYTLCETITIGFDRTRTWMLVERAVRDGVDQSLAVADPLAVDAAASIKDTLMKLMRSDDFRTSRTGWSRDKEYLRLMIMVGTGGVFKLNMVEMDLHRTPLFASQGEEGGPYKTCTRSFPEGLPSYVENSADNALRSNYVIASSAANRLRLSSESDCPTNRDYWKTVAAIDAFEAYAQGYRFVESNQSEYRIDLSSAAAVLRSFIRIAFLLIFLAVWNWDNKLSVFSFHITMAAETVYDIIMFMQLCESGRDLGSKAVLMLITMRLLLLTSQASLSVSFIVGPLLLLFNQVVSEIVRSGSLAPILLVFEIRNLALDYPQHRNLIVVYVVCSVGLSSQLGLSGS